MVTLSDRAKKLPGSAIRRFIPMALELKDKGIQVYKLNIGQPDIKTSEHFFKATRDFKQPVVEYEHSLGYIELRKNLVKYYEKNDINVDIDDIIITTGGSEALIIVFGLITNPQDEIIVPEPYYTNYNTFAVQNDIVLVPLKTTIEDNFLLTNIEILETLITKKTKAILLSNPCNPTGAVFTEDQLKKVAEVAKKHNLFIISDEVYREFVYDGKKSISILQIPGTEERSIIIDSVSKRYSACGARIGWIVCKNKDLMSAALKFAQARLSVPTLEQYAVNEMVLHGEDDIKRAKKEYDKRRKYAYEKLTSAGIKCGYPAGALYMIADIGVDAEEFVKFMLTDYSGIEKYKETTLVTPAETFYKTPGMGKTQIRIAFVLEISKLEKAIFHLLEGLKEFNA